MRQTKGKAKSDAFLATHHPGCYAAGVDRENFEQYLRVMTSLKPRTQKRYATDGMEFVTLALHRLGLLDASESVYDVQSYERLLGFDSALRHDPWFQERNQKGNRMYSSGFHHLLAFAKGQWIRTSGGSFASLVCSPQPSYHTIEETVPNRKKILVIQTLEAEHFTCQAHPEHQTFLVHSYGETHPYMEGHHLIPLACQGEFSCSLDVYANIVSLCPLCHRQIHYGLADDRKKMVGILFDERKDFLSESGIHASKQEVWELLKLA